MSDAAAGSRVNGTTPTADQLEADIAQQREQLAATVDALLAKLDVPTRARHKADDLKQSLTDERGRPRPEAIAAAVAVVVLLGGLIALRSRRHS